MFAGYRYKDSVCVRVNREKSPAVNVALTLTQQILMSAWYHPIMRSRHTRVDTRRQRHTTLSPTRACTHTRARTHARTHTHTYTQKHTHKTHTQNTHTQNTQKYLL